MLNTQLSSVLKASADPIRLDILRLLKRDSLAASELASVLQVKQSALSHHLKVMTQSQWLSPRREGNMLFYRRQLSSNSELMPMQRGILQVVDAQPLSEQHASALQQIRAERQQVCAEFFAEHATELDAVTDRIAGYQHYAATLQQALSQLHLAHGKSALEIGPGKGGFLPYLSQQFDQVYALDIAEPMLALARSQSAGLNNIEFVQGDTQAFLAKGLTVDFAAVNMVLHHIPSPAELFAECWQLLHTNGWLVITDLCAHEQDWVREACGDFWLGFDPDELLHWATSAGFAPQPPVFLGLRNGFQVQIQLFQKTLAPGQLTQ